MMELFKPNGHLTGEGLRALCDEKLDELERLEVSEHLSFCDDCLTAYLAVLDGTTLLQVPRPMADVVLKAGKRKGRAVLLARYTSVAAAAALAVTLWGTGLLGTFSDALADFGSASQPPPGASQSEMAEAGTEADAPRAPLGARFDTALAGVNGYFNRLFTGPATPEATDEEDPTPRTERERREALFDTDNANDDTSNKENEQ